MTLSSCGAVLRAGLVLVTGAVVVLAPAAPAAHAATVDSAASYAVVARHSGKALQVQSTADGGAVVQASRTDSAAQQFQFVDSGGGYYRLKSRHSGKVVDIASSSTANGANVVQWTDNNAANQQFSLVDTDAGHVRIVNRNSGKALDVWERSTADGARVSQYDVNGGTNQQWQLVRLGGGAPGGDGSPTDPNVKYFGRWNTADPTAYVSEWAGAYVVVGFTGRTVQLKQRNAIDFFASIDGGPDVSYVNRSGTVNLTPTPLAAGNHTLRVSYRPIAGSYRGDAVFRGVQLDAGATTFAPPAPAKLVEFVGDSITVGQQSSKQALTAYGWLVGERLGAGHTQIAVGGACLVPAADGCIGMSDRFLRTGLQADAANWDFSRYRADAVVINLGTNDVGHGVTGAQFQSAYVTLIQRARQKYPNATILALQTFRKRFIPETQAAVRIVNDPKVRFVDTTGWIVEATDTTDNVHPNDQGHRKIADRLAPVLSTALATAQAVSAPEPCAATDQAAGPGAAAAPFKVWLAGDSTMANGSGTCPVGWGREFDRLFNDDVTVVNNAVGGRSIQTWLYESNVKSTKDAAGECVVSPRTYASRWADMLSTNGMQPGDWLIIQFGINDGDPNCPRHVGTALYRQLLSTMAREAKARGAKPVFVTPVASIRCSGSTAVGNRGFVTETVAQAQADQVPVIDLHQRSVALYNSLRLCPNNGDYTQGAVGAFFCNDHTHFEAAGAARIAQVVAGALREQGIGLASSLRPTSTTYGLVAQHSGKAADVDAASTAAGARLVQWTANGGRNQRFEFIDTGDGHVRIKAQHSGLVLQVSGNDSGADITQQPDTGAASQQWRVVDHGGDVISLVNRQSGLAMDVWGKSTADGARISQYAYSGSPNQRFTRQRG